jgi:hypothetical protein
VSQELPLRALLAVYLEWLALFFRTLLVVLLRQDYQTPQKILQTTLWVLVYSVLQLAHLSLVALWLTVL